MDTTNLATPQAVRDFLDERKALFRAFDHDLKQGVSANEIARMAAGAFSRPVVLAYLNAKQLAADVRRVLRVARLDGIFGAEITGEVGRGAREVCITLVVDPQEIERDQDALVGDLTDVLLADGIEIATPKRSSIAATLWDGELVQLRRSRTPANADRRQDVDQTGSRRAKDEGKRVGDPVVFAYNEPSLGLTAGTPGTLTAIRTPDDVDFETADGRKFTTQLDMVDPAATDVAD